MSQARNVIFILTDQQHFRTLGCHGTAEARTPHIDALAASGIDFSNHFVVNPVCSPSRASIMTGRYPTEHGLWTNGCRLPESQRTIANVMGDAGWQTVHFGKLHLVPIITRVAPHPPYGFSTHVVAEGDQQLLDDDYFRWLRVAAPDLFVRYVTEMYSEGHAKGYTSCMPEDMHQSTWVTGEAIKWLEDARNPEEPFFLSVGYFDPHHAFNPCEPYASAFADAEVTPPVYDAGSIATRPTHYRAHFSSCEKYTRDSEHMTGILRAYHAMMAHVDKCIGDLMGTVSRLGLSEDTVVIFTSDHGELLGNHGMLWKGPYMLDDLMRVPLIVSAPGHPRAGCQSDELTSSVDLFATIQAAAGIETPERASGRPFLDTALNLFPDGPRTHVLAEWESTSDSPTSSVRMVRTRDEKLVTYRSSAAEWGEYYDVKSDPHEFWNRYTDPSSEDARRQLANRIPLRNRPDIPSEGGW